MILCRVCLKSLLQNLKGAVSALPASLQKTRAPHLSDLMFGFEPFQTASHHCRAVYCFVSKHRSVVRQATPALQHILAYCNAANKIYTSSHGVDTKAKGEYNNNSFPTVKIIP